MRTADDLANPTLPGGVYGKYITKGIPVYWKWDGTNTYGIIFISDGGKYGLCDLDSFEYRGAILTAGTDYKFHPGTYSTGFTDTLQGTPTFLPEVETTFNNIAYVEFKLPTSQSTSDEPAWGDFRIVGTGRKLMDYDSSGSALGVTSTLSSVTNVALQIADNCLVNMKLPTSRIGWSSWSAFKSASAALVYYNTGPAQIANDGTGLQGKYYSDTSFTTLFATQTDPTIDFDWPSGDGPFVSLVGTYGIRWTGKILPRYSETYTFTLRHDDHGKVIVNGSTLFDQAAAGTHTGTIALTAGTLYSITVEMSNSAGAGAAALSWQSTSQALQIVPAERLYMPDQQYRRYEAHIAFGTPTEASAVHETLMRKCPGWDWTDLDGKITFLAPDRTLAFTFHAERPSTPLVKANWTKGSFQRKRRPMADRKNFRLYRFRDVAQTGFPYAYASSDRDVLREYAGGIPSNDDATDLGVSNASLAQRIADTDMALGTDPDHTLSLSGGRASSIIRKGMIVYLFYNNKFDPMVSGYYLVQFHSWGSPVEQNDFTLLPVAYPYYTDDPV